MSGTAFTIRAWWLSVVVSAFSLISCSASHRSIAQDAIAPVAAPFPMEQPVRPSIPDRRFDIREFGAKEGGAVINTDAIRAAIHAATDAGGGRIVIPAGTWLTGAIHLENNCDLHVEKGARLLFSQNFDDYLPVVFSRHEDVECYKHSAFIYANGKTNIAITGEGILDGQGKPWWGFKESKKEVEKLLYEMGMQNVPVQERVFDGTGGRILRPAFFQPMRCRNILVEGVTFLYGAFWTITPTYCENIIVRNVKITTEGEYGHTPNGDGVDPSSCKNILIENCEFDTGDDCIAIKAGRDADGLRVALPTENIVIRNCVGYRGHGGIVIGSETSGSIRNVYAYNCRFSGTDRIVRIKTARGRGGILENMWFDNLRGENIAMEAIHLNMLYTGERLPAQPVSATTPIIRNIHLSNITCGSGKSYGMEMLGLPEQRIENVTVSGIDMATAKGIACTDVQGVRIVNARVRTQASPVVTIMDGSNVDVDSLMVAEGVQPILRIDGSLTSGVRIRHTDAATKPGAVVVGDSVAHDAVRVGE
jgi:polygalacturonase